MEKHTPVRREDHVGDGGVTLARWKDIFGVMGKLLCLGQKFRALGYVSCQKSKTLGCAVRQKQAMATEMSWAPRPHPNVLWPIEKMKALLCEETSGFLRAGGQDENTGGQILQEQGTDA